jgi:hypothetical protein
MTIDSDMPDSVNLQHLTAEIREAGQLVIYPEDSVKIEVAKEGNTPERMTPEEWHFFTDVWTAGIVKVRLTDGWDSDDDTQRLLQEVDRKLLNLKPSC